MSLDTAHSTDCDQKLLACSIGNTGHSTFQGVWHVYQAASGSVRDIIACGFDEDLTFIFTNFQYFGADYSRNISRIQRCISFNCITALFGMTAEDNIGKMAFRAIQAAAALSSNVPHIFVLSMCR